MSVNQAAFHISEIRNVNDTCCMYHGTNRTCRCGVIDNENWQHATLTTNADLNDILCAGVHCSIVSYQTPAILLISMCFLG